MQTQVEPSRIKWSATHVCITGLSSLLTCAYSPGHGVPVHVKLENVLQMRDRLGSRIVKAVLLAEEELGQQELLVWEKHTEYETERAGGEGNDDTTVIGVLFRSHLAL